MIEPIEGIDEPAENWTKFPNWILDNLPLFRRQQLKIISAMIRRTIGYAKKNRRFSITYIMLITGIKSRSTVVRDLQDMREKGYVIKVRKGRDGDVYRINWAEPKRGRGQKKQSVLVQNLNQQNQRSKKWTAAGPKSGPLAVQKVDPLLDNSIRNQFYIAPPGEGVGEAAQLESIRCRVTELWPQYNQTEINRAIDTAHERGKSNELQYIAALMLKERD